MEEITCETSNRLVAYYCQGISVRDVGMDSTIRMIGDRLSAYKILVATLVGNDRLNTTPYTGR